MFSVHGAGSNRTRVQSTIARDTLPPQAREPAGGWLSPWLCQPQMGSSVTQVAPPRSGRKVTVTVTATVTKWKVGRRKVTVTATVTKWAEVG